MHHHIEAGRTLKKEEQHIILEAALKRVEQLLGLRYQQHQWSDLLRLLKPAARELGFDDVTACVAWLGSGDVSPMQVQILGKHLTIGESYFFREIIAFSLMREHVLPEIIEAKEKQGHRELRIWSAGCSSGEEVYSVAILVDSMLDKRDGWNISVLGTDVNPSAIERAREGRYREWSFRDIPAGIIQEYFRGTEDGKLQISDRIRVMTEFRMLNLAAPHAEYPCGFDIILCRNVLMYFTRPKIQHIVQGFRRSVLENGWLIPSLTETTLINNPGFEGVRFGDATLFRKQGRVSHILSLKKKPAEKVGESDPYPAMGEETASAMRQWNVLPEKRQVNTSDGTAAEISAPGFHSATKPETGITSTATRKRRHERAESRHVEELIDTARRYADQGEFPEALAAARGAVETEKMNSQAHIIYATILRETGKTSLAMQEFHRALYLDHGSIPAHFAVGSMYRHLGRNDRARRHFRNALELLESCEDKNAVVDPGGLSVRRMIEIITTMLSEL